VRRDDFPALSLGVPSMELPVLYALTFPDRVSDTGVPPFDPVALSPLTFEPVRRDDFPALSLGMQAGRAGGAAPAVFNAANEAAVARFLDGAIRFGDIPRAIESALARFAAADGGSREAILSADALARRHVQELF
jgi:1-deoxy-D-xylulose-5-phosphate reductoisomerase